ncbi:MAG: sulfotransferase [Alteromonadaceae bacterium]|nr:sulfotransferase [Paraglaciecola agarilytica]MBN25728.1 sulfotransferase [Alteromonadaceae bacterium]|tara:strand:+ start:161284 stop:162216 length:933 start_codon:yes stop_codon:yes gene_type:complete
MMKNLVRPVFIGGCERSGTTFLADMIGKFDRSLVVPESQFIADVLGRRDDFSNIGEIKSYLAHSFRFKVWDVDISLVDIADDSLNTVDNLRILFNQIVKAYAEKVNVLEFDVWVDHTPSNTWYSASLIELYPDANFIHIVRDGRAVCNSVLKLDWGPNTVTEAATWWAGRLSLGLLSEVYLGERCIRLHYESIIVSTHDTIVQLLDFLNMSNSFESEQNGFTLPSYTSNQHKLVGSKPQPARIDGWRREMSEESIGIFEKSTFEMLPMLGYEKVGIRPDDKSLLLEYCFIRPILFMKNVIRNKLRKSRIL